MSVCVYVCVGEKDGECVYGSVFLPHTHVVNNAHQVTSKPHVKFQSG